MSQERFDLPIAAALRLESRSGNVRVIAEPRDDVVAESDGLRASDEDRGRVLQIRSGRHGAKSLTVWCPAGTDISIGTMSGSVTMEGEFGDVAVTTMSGSINVDCADDADLRTISGSITLRCVSGEVRMSTKSGTIKAEEAGSALASTVSGSIELGKVEGDARARSVSGTIELGCCGAGTVKVKTVSGKVRIALPPGTHPRTRLGSMSGNVRVDMEQGDDCRVDAMSLSGSIEIVPS